MVQKIPTCFSGLENLATSVIMLNAAKQVVYMNPSAEVLFALSSTQLVNSDISAVFLNLKHVPLKTITKGFKRYTLP